MELNTSNSSTNESASDVDFAKREYISACTIVLLLLLAVVVADLVIVAAMFVEKTIPRSVCTLLTSQLVGCLLNATTLIIGIVTSLVLLSQFPTTYQPFGLCRAILFFFGIGIVSRMYSLVSFSLLVLAIVKWGKNSVLPSLIVIAVLVIWVSSFMLNIDTLIPPIYGVQYYKGIVCIYNPEFQEEVRDAIDTLWIILTGFIPLIVSVVIPIIVLFYIKHHVVSEAGGYNKSMAKFSLFLVGGKVITLIGLVIPLLAARKAVGVYVSYAFAVLSLIPPPILALIFLNPVRKRLKRLISCDCTLFKEISSTSTRSESL